ncbi:MAG: hypothetical protein HZA51_06840 [Planctomycetes bacterium]|nr:hypothetical protein [Planctomycetota bacterium]
MNHGQNATVSIDDAPGANGRFVVAWQSAIESRYYENIGTWKDTQVLLNRFTADGACFDPNTGPRPLSCRHCTLNTFHTDPSVSVRNGTVFAGWIGEWTVQGIFVAGYRPAILFRDFSFTADPSSWTTLGPQNECDLQNRYPSVGLGGSSKFIGWTREYTNQSSYKHGLLHSAASATQLPLEICQAGTNGNCTERPTQWGPCVASRSDDYHVMVWCKEEEMWQYPHFDIYMTILDSAGEQVVAPICVNQTTKEDPSYPTVQRFPAVAADDAGNIAVVWTGSPLVGHPSQGDEYARRVYLRLFRWEPGMTTPLAVADEVQVNSAYSYTLPYDPLYYEVGNNVNPTVALSKENNGRMLVAWNTRANSGSGGFEVHGQYFHRLRPLGTEFRIHQDTVDVPPEIVDRRLGQSGQHTISYGPDDQVVVAWTRSHTLSLTNIPDKNQDVYFTILPPGFADYLASQVAQCCKGDMDGLGSVNGDDTQFFIDMVLAPPSPASFANILDYYAAICPADTNNDGALNEYDVDPYITLFFQGTCNPQGIALPTSPPFYDCTGNIVEDLRDIANATSQDCNNNGMPDECEFLLWIGGTNDCNANGIPDECDIASGLEQDCGINGIPDSCEIAVNPALDCNQNGVLDECDLKQGPPDGSLDCNDNGIPDECDVANQTSADCNQNGIPDSCDIASGHSPDRFPRDGIPDECAILDNGPTMLETTLVCEPASDLDVAWAELRVWAAQQQWGPDAGITGAEQYQRYVDKLCELGLVDVVE